jgi:hypothetical protein
VTDSGEDLGLCSTQCDCEGRSSVGRSDRVIPGPGYACCVDGRATGAGDCRRCINILELGRDEDSDGMTNHQPSAGWR